MLHTESLYLVHEYDIANMASNRQTGHSFHGVHVKGPAQVHMGDVVNGDQNVHHHHGAGEGMLMSFAGKTRELYLTEKEVADDHF